MENEFDFNPAPILNKIDALIGKFDQLFETLDSDRGKKGVDDLEDSVENSSESVSNFGKTGELSIKKLIAVAGLLTAGFFALKAAFTGLPAVSEAFAVMGNTIKHNVLAPIAQELLPALNSLIAWIHDSRALFVSIGAVIGNVFTTLISFVKQFAGLAQRLFSGVINKISEVFGSASTGIGDMLRLLTTKIVAGVGFLMLALEPVIDLFINVFGLALQGVKNLFGFIAEHKDIFTILTSGVIAYLVTVKTIIALTRAWVIIQALLNATMTLNPVGLIVAAIVALGVGLVLLYRRSEKFRNAISAIIDVAKMFFNIWIAGINKYVALFRKLIDFFASGVNSWIAVFRRIGGIIRQYLIDPIKFAIDWISEKFDEFFGWFEKKWEKFKVALSKIKNIFTEEPETAAVTGQQVNNQTIAPVNNASNKEVKVSINMPVSQNITGENAEQVSSETAKMIADKTVDQINRQLMRNQEANGL